MALQIGGALTDGGVGLRHLSRAAQRKSWLPSEVVAESFPLSQATSVTMTTTNRRLRLAGGLVVPAGRTVTDIEFWTGTTPAAVLTHILMGLYDLNFNLVATTADAGTVTWAASEAKRLALSVSYAPTVDTPVYAGVIMEVGTPPTLLATSAVSTAVDMSTGRGPSLGGQSTTVGTVVSAMPNPADTLTTGSAAPYVRLIGS